MILAAIPVWFQTIIDNPTAVITWVVAYSGTLGVSIIAAITAIIKVKTSATSLFNKSKSAMTTISDTYKAEMEKRITEKIAEKTSSIDKLIVMLSSARVASNAVPVEEKKDIINLVKELTGEALEIPEKIQIVLENIKEIDIQTVLNGETIEEASDEKTN